MPLARVRDAEIYYERHGDGPPVMLVPGLNGEGHWWEPQIAAFARHFTTVIHDHRGTGRSTHSEIDYSIEQMADDLIGLMDALGIARAHIVGVSTGGAMAQVLATDHAARTRSVVIANSWSKADAYRQRVAAVRKNLVMHIGPNAYVEASPLFLFPPRYLRDNAEAVARGCERALKYFPSPRIAASRLDAGLAFDRRDALRGIAIPALVIGAKDDQLTPAYYSEELAAIIPGARLHLFEQGGHACSRTMAAEFNAVTLDFLLGLGES
jgi:aminoacrylate hydrolase